MTQIGEFLSIFTVWRLWISERRLAVDNEFNSATQEILKVEDVIFTWRSKGVLNDTIQRHFIYFSWNCLAEINCWLRILWYDPKKSKGGRCDSYLEIERCLKWHNLENILSIFTVLILWISERRLGFNSAIQKILQVDDVIFTWRSRGVLNYTIRRHFVDFFLI